MIIIIDFGSQTCHLISRRLRDFSVDTKIIEPSEALKSIAKYSPTGIILSGGPSSVHDDGAPTVDKKIYSLDIPMLAICYGWQLTAHLLGGIVRSGHKEYGPTTLRRISPTPLFNGISKKIWTAWMSHGDEVVKLPEGFSVLASTPTVSFSAVVHKEKQIYGVLFHPEVTHTQFGKEVLVNFLHMCKEHPVERVVKLQDLVNRVYEVTDAAPDTSVAVGAISGGVDSTVAAAIVASVLGKRFIPIYCDNGLMRSGTKEEIQELFVKQFRIHPIIIDCKKLFLQALKGITDPEEKRKTIGRLYIKIFEEQAKRIPNVKWLVQGTIYSDVIESKGTKHADKIKSHHNVGGLPETMGLTLLEPIRTLYKDEVRMVGRELDVPKDIVDEMVGRQPFPGPGAAIRILGEVTETRLSQYHQADTIVLEVMRETGWYKKVFQSFPIMTGLKTTAVKGDGRVYGELVGLRVYDSSDIMTAGWTKLPYDVLQTISTRIVNEVPGVSRVVYDITTKPPATMEWE